MEYAMMRVAPGSTEPFAEKSLVTTLIPKQCELNRLTALGVTNEAIADKSAISASGVKQALQAISDKRGASRDVFAALL